MDRGLAPVVGKTLEAGIVLLYVAGIVAVLYGGVLPDYRAATGAEVTERTLATTAERIEAAVPPRSSAVDATLSVSLPETIDSAAYRMRVANGTLVLDHPDPELSGRARLALPARTDVTGTWESDDRTRLRIRGDAARVRVILA